MKCANISRCKNFNIINIDNNYLCLTCSSIFKKNKKKILIKCCKEQIINRRTNIPYCINCYRTVYS